MIKNFKGKKIVNLVFSLIYIGEYIYWNLVNVLWKIKFLFYLKN